MEIFKVQPVYDEQIEAQIEDLSTIINKGLKPLTISVDEEKPFDKIQHPITVGIEGTYPNLINAICVAANPQQTSYSVVNT